MARSTKTKRQTRKAAARRPASVMVRLPAELVARIDAWAVEHGAPTRADAAGKLVEAGLAKKTRPPVAAQQLARAATLAGRQIDRMSDPAVTTEERATRKRRLTDGPSVFREVRRDRAKRKTRE
jgi:hypothetical protein